MSRLWALLAAVAVALGVLVASAAANNDPHRSFFPAASFDVPTSYCGFPVHFDPVAFNEYGTTTTLPDGSTLVNATGTAKALLTEPDTGQTVAVNGGGPGTALYAPGFSTASLTFKGHAFLYMTNLTDFGFPSNLVETSGLMQMTVAIDPISGQVTVTGLTRMPHIALDLCAALAP
jgi:hypothetical protein